MSGLELCWETRLLAGSQRPIYVILMSGSTSEDRLAMALDHGADDILNNPPAADELYARLRAAERFGNMQRELIRLAVTDSLTGMYNRRGFFEQAVQPCLRAERRRAALRRSWPTSTTSSGSTTATATTPATRRSSRSRMS